MEVIASGGCGLPDFLTCRGDADPEKRPFESPTLLLVTVCALTSLRGSPQNLLVPACLDTFDNISCYVLQQAYIFMVQNLEGRAGYMVKSAPPAATRIPPGDTNAVCFSRVLPRIFCVYASRCVCTHLKVFLRPQHHVPRPPRPASSPY